jgi:hypothetical protein
MTIEELRTELEKVISDLSSSGFSSIDSATVEKLETFAAASDELGMKAGTRLIENLSGVMKAIQEGKSGADSGNIRLTALDFYVKKLSDSGSVEDL